MPRELLMMQNSFQWGTAEGQTLEIENAMRSNVRDLKIEGQTYQNLSINSSGKTTMTSGGFVYLLNSTNGADMIKLNTTYTLIIDIKDAYYTSNNFGLLTSIEYSNGTSTSYIALTEQTSGRYVRTFTFKNPVKSMNLGVHNSNTSDCYCDMSSIILLEGDYTNSYVPSNINGIESIAEREFEQNLYTDGDLNVKGKVAWYNVKKYVACKPNTNYTFSCNIESVNKGDYNAKPFIEIYTNEKLPSNRNINLSESGSASFTTNNEAKQLIIYFFVNNEKYSSTECEANFKNIELYESVSYPVNIAQSNNETDGITLPNGVKNTIENGVYIRRIGKYTITGNEQYKLRYENDAMFTIQNGGLSIEPMFDDYNNSNTKMICDKVLCGDCSNPTFVSNSLTIGGRLTNSKGFVIAIPKSLLTEYTIDKAKEYVQSLGGLTVWYQLATPITEPIALTEIPLPQPLRSLPNGVCDEVVGNKLIQRIGKLILDGSQRIVKDSETTLTVKFKYSDTSIKNVIKEGSESQICTVLPSNMSSIYNNDEEGAYIWKIYNVLFMSIKKERLDTLDVDGFKNFLINNPMTIYYELATPIEHTISVPPISISKGSNTITTTNNIKPNLSIKYKQSKNIIKYLYNSGNEYLNITGGWNTQLNASYGAATTIVKNANNIYFPTGVWNMLLTNNKIDVTNYDVVYMKYSKEYNPYNFHPARCAIKLGNKNTSWNDFANDETTGTLIGKDETENNVTNGILSIDVSNITGSYYVGIGGQSNNITVHEIGLKKVNKDTIILYSNGNENTSLTGGYLTSSNNSATCNIEKQADNLYVNCTGKQSFDSICYARTNKTIKPCKIKVSVKNNYISANGIAFCVFLSEKEAITSVSDFNSAVNKKYIKASNTTQGQYIDLEIDLTDNTEGYFYIACMVAGSADYTCKANIRKIEIIR